jgi:hypothetical protein
MIKDGIAFVVISVVGTAVLTLIALALMEGTKILMERYTIGAIDEIDAIKFMASLMLGTAIYQMLKLVVYGFYRSWKNKE